MIRLHLPREPNGLFVYDFSVRFFRHRRLNAGYGVCVYILYNHRAISLIGFYNGPVQSCRQTVQRSYVHCRSCGHRDVSTAMHRNRTDIVRLLPYGGCAEIVRWLCDPRVFFFFFVKALYLLLKANNEKPYNFFLIYFGRQKFQSRTTP